MIVLKGRELDLAVRAYERAADQDEIMKTVSDFTKEMIWDKIISARIDMLWMLTQ